MKKEIENKNEIKIKDCPEFPYFGATYPDATCINGWLWDLDSYEDGKLYGGGEEPCPFCNPDFIEHNLDPLNGVTKKVLKDYIKKLKAKYS